MILALHEKRHCWFMANMEYTTLSGTDALASTFHHLGMSSKVVWCQHMT